MELESLPAVAKRIGVSEALLRSFVKGKDTHGKSLEVLPTKVVRGRHFLDPQVAHDHIKAHCARLPKNLTSPATTTPAKGCVQEVGASFVDRAAELFVDRLCALFYLGERVMISSGSRSEGRPEVFAALVDEQELDRLERIYDVQNPQAWPVWNGEVLTAGPYGLDEECLLGETTEEKIESYIKTNLYQMASSLNDGLKVKRCTLWNWNTRRRYGAMVPLAELEWLERNGSPDRKARGVYLVQGESRQPE